MNLQNLRMLEMAADHLDSLLEEVVFLGGASIELWISDPAAPEFRPTVDVDIVVEIVTKPDYYRFQDRVLGCGFVHDVDSGVICRFEHPDTGLILDVMPTEAAILGFENRWQGEAFLHAEEFSGEGCQRETAGVRCRGAARTFFRSRLRLGTRGCIALQPGVARTG